MEVMRERSEFYANPTVCICETTKDDPSAAGAKNSEDDPTRTEEVIDIGAGDDSFVRWKDTELEEILISWVIVQLKEISFCIPVVYVVY